MTPTGGHIFEPWAVLSGMTNPVRFPSGTLPLDIPDWLTHDVWPFPTAALDLDGHHVAFSDSGGDGQVLLFCHIGLWSLLWRDLMVEMSKTHRCITLDTPGVGQSSRIARGDQTMTTAVRAVGALMTRLTSTMWCSWSMISAAWPGWPQPTTGSNG